MPALTTYAQTQVLKALFQGTNLTAPALFFALHTVSKGTWTGATLYTSGDTIISTTGGNGHIYKCILTGTSSSVAPSFPTAFGGTVNDNTTRWQEESYEINNGTIVNEVSGGAYARVSIAASAGNFPISLVSTADEQVQNAATITFANPTANWGTCAWCSIWDASSAGNMWSWGALTTAVSVVNAGLAPQFALNAFTFQSDT